jgi:3-hydroxyacyl-CoA dehydrogenase / enoyl-CoA hydratase / 3-hydroxybutyryl-CoA epimerase
MGSGIATVLSDKGVRSLLLDRNSDGVQKGVYAVQSYFADRVRRKRLKRFEALSKVSMVTPAVHYESLKGCPFVIEAVFEELSVKHQVLQKVENTFGQGLIGQAWNGRGLTGQNSNQGGFIFASNTSSIPIQKVAEGAQNPKNVIGMHFFSPVPKMPLVEIIMGPKTSDIVGSATFDVSSTMGKNIIVVNDGPGFYTTRILAFYMSEAVLMLSEGARIEDLDHALEKFGMPVGPMTLLDEVGLDVGGHIMDTLRSAFPDRFVVPPEVNLFLEEKRFGRKVGKGMYRYEDGKKLGPDESVYKHLKHGSDRKSFAAEEIVDRCMLVFQNEATRCLEEGVLRSEDAGDLGAVFGLGYPPFLGGPFFHGAKLGKAQTREKLLKFSEKYGARFAPTSWWN